MTSSFLPNVSKANTINPSSASVVAQVTALGSMTMQELRALWDEFYDEPPPNYRRAYIERRLAYQLQVRAQPPEVHDLIADNKRRIQEIIEYQKRPSSKKLKLTPGTILTRLYEGRDHQVVVQADDNFEYQGRRYKSLSKIAREITGTQWSGPLFFGLRRATTKAKNRDKKHSD